MEERILPGAVRLLVLWAYSIPPICRCSEQESFYTFSLNMVHIMQAYYYECTHTWMPYHKSRDDLEIWVAMN